MKETRLTEITSMAKILCEDYEQCNNCRFSNPESETPCTVFSECESLYEAGYRRQRVGENISENHPVDEFVCSECGLIVRDCGRYELDEDDGDEICYEFAFRFCPRCGVAISGD